MTVAICTVSCSSISLPLMQIKALQRTISGQPRVLKVGSEGSSHRIRNAMPAEDCIHPIIARRHRLMYNVRGLTIVRRTAVGLIVVCAVLLWVMLPIFIVSPNCVLTLAVNPSMNSDCPAGSACFTMELRNRGPWPITIDIMGLQFYPSLIGPGVNVKWLEPGPDRPLVLIPFTGHQYTFWIKIMGGLRPPDRVYVILTAKVTVLYASHYVVLHSGKR
jgi:hypothetical protein